MKISLVIVLLCAAVSFGALEDEWENFKITFKKTYATPQHDQMRRKVFEANLRKIREHNYEADLGKHRYQVGINEYSDLTLPEYRKILLGYRKPKKNQSQASSSSTFMRPASIKLPKKVDWRKHGYVTDIKNQGNCGSCWAFSTTGSLEGQYFRKTGKLVPLSEQQLVDCSGGFSNQGCEGGLMDQAFEYIKLRGIESEKSYPYIAIQRQCDYKPRDIVIKDNGFVNVLSNEEDLKFAVASVGPISVAINASHAGFMHYKSGVYYEPVCSGKWLDHGVLVVGYGTTSGDKPEDFWIVKNSWGKSWGMDGYILMARNRNNNCGIASAPSFPLI